MFDKIKNSIKKGLLVASGVVLAAGNAMADGWSPTVTVDTAPVFTVAGVVIGASAGIWAIRKVIKLMSHS